ncbi:unnamed protein product [Arctogadus glacialis]
MACPTFLDETLSTEEREFQKVISQIGGKEKLHLVSEARKTEENETGIMEEFIEGMFNSTSTDLTAGDNAGRNNNDSVRKSPSCQHGDSLNENGIVCETETLDVTTPKEKPLTESSVDLGIGVKPTGEDFRPQPNGDLQRTATKSINMSCLHRTIASPVIIFIFSQEFLKGLSKKACVKEILKDVRARTKRANPKPVLLGLVRTTLESGDTRQCVEFLEHLIRSVFRKRLQEAIWVGTFVPNQNSKILVIKENACRVWYSSQAADHTTDGVHSSKWHSRCLPWPVRREPRGHVCSSPTSKERGDAGSLEEGIPLKTFSVSTGSHAQGGTTAVDN